MKKLFLLSVSMLAFGLMSCGDKQEKYTYEYDGFTITFAAPKGFFTPSKERKDFVRGSDFSGAVAYVGESFTMNISVVGCNYTLERWNGFVSSMWAKEELYQEIKIDGIIAAHRRYVSPKIKYSMLGELEQKCISIDFSPNDIKNLPSEEYRDAAKEAGYLKKCIELSNNKVIQDIINSVKVTKN
jgi:hypothetical protein